MGMKKKALLVCRQNPYPLVRGGIERLIINFESYILSDYDVYFLHHQESPHSILFHQGEPLVAAVSVEELLAHGFRFFLYFNYEFDLRSDDVLGPLLDRVPAFSFMQSHPLGQAPDTVFRGIFAHSSAGPHKDVLRFGGTYDSRIFYKDRRDEDFIICVGRLNRDKNQAELVEGYKERIYDRYGLPLYLVGGVYSPKFLDYALEVSRHVDNSSVLSTLDLQNPLSDSSWKRPRQIADLCNRARMFVMASPEESFCIALVEAMACGTTCVVNGSYNGFDGEELKSRVYGNVTAKHGSILDTLEDALERGVRIDASDWVRKYSLAEAKKAALDFIDERL